MFSTACIGILTFFLSNEINFIGEKVNDLLKKRVYREIGVAIRVISTFILLA